MYSQKQSVFCEYLQIKANVSSHTTPIPRTYYKYETKFFSILFHFEDIYETAFTSNKKADNRVVSLSRIGWLNFSD